jgi:hypothetical protein
MMRAARFNREALVVGLVCMLLCIRVFGDDAKEIPPPTSAALLQQLLQKKLNIEGIDPNTPLRDVLHHFSATQGFTILVDVQAYHDDLQVQEPDQMPTKLPKMTQVTLRAILNQIAKQVQGAVIQEGTILWLVPQQRARMHLMQQPVDVQFSKTHLEQALQQITDQTGFSIVLDTYRGAENAKVPISAKLHGVGLEDAVQMLANLAGLKAVLIGDALYVTTEENAAQLEQEQQKRESQRKVQLVPGAAGS